MMSCFAKRPPRGMVPLPLVLCLLSWLWGWAGADPVTVYRDTWGVPHVYATDLGEAAYGLGYAQAADRLDDIFINVRTAIGRMAEAFGADFVERDYIMRLVKNGERCEAYWRTAPAEVRELGDGFVAGVEAWMAEHPDEAPPFALPLEGWHCLAVGRAMILNWPLESLQAELRNKKIRSGVEDSAKDEIASSLEDSLFAMTEREVAPPPFGSNSFAIGPSRSAEHCAIVMTDPHLTWEGMAVFYEARLHAGEDGLCGFWLVGSPLPVLGHGSHVAFACTTGGPDTSDVFMVKLNPANPMQYAYEDGWKDFEVEQASIPVAGGDAVVRPALWSAIGPVLEAPDVAKGVAYCGASPYLDAVRLMEQQRAMLLAKDVDGFYDALRMNQLMEQNISFADTAGNIEYVRNGCTPIRPEGFNWKAPVPWSEASQWRGMHPLEDLVQIKNPVEGYFQNCNNSPQWMSAESPMTPGQYPDYIYNVTWDDKTPRGVRLLALLAPDTSITKDEAKAYTLDVYDILAEAWQEALQDAVSNAGAEAEAEVTAAVETILAWDGNFTRESKAAPIVRYWRLKAEAAGLSQAVAEGRPLSAKQQGQLIQALADGVAEMKSLYGTAEVTWGDINLIGRGGRYFACPGAEFGGGGQLARTETVMDVGTKPLPDAPGKFVGNDGSSSTMIMFLHAEGIESYSVLNWGQSGDPESPHYVDQAEQLYAERGFKPTWFAKEELLQHVESKRVLETAP
ncbi:MAG: penicillin acylase family protein [Candidatus Hydrogenedentes bacterium]|nr:penicillin acylase family protein [Candidatus Hydrogenedentota bacterium]